MKVVAGEARGRRLSVPPGRTVRPTPGRVREALMSALQQLIPEARVLDLFAGSGSLAIEALSRGARDAVLVDRDRGAVRVVARNLEACGLSARARILRGDALASLERLEATGERFDLVFLDPPYASELAARALGRLAGSPLLAEGARLVVEHAPGEEPDPPPRGLELLRTVVYGDTCLSYLAPRDD